MAQLVTVRLNRGDAQPWGFRLQGGKDFGTPLVVQKVAGGSIAANAGLSAGDAVIKVNGLEVYNLRHKDAQDAVVRGGNNFEITVQRGGSTWRPAVTPTGSLPSPTIAPGGMAPVTRTSLAAKPQEVQQFGSGFNSAARPFAVNGSEGVKSIVNKQYNTPVGIYSDESIAETLSAQAEVLAGGVLGVNFKKNEKIYNSANSEVFKMLQEAENDPNEPEESSTFSPTPYQSSNQQLSPVGGVTKHVTAPVAQAKPPGTGGLPAGQNICAECERLIVGVFVRIKEKNLHVDCFKCATCGTPLKNQGYFNINNKLYCDIHAKLAAINNPPPGTEGYLPVPIKPNTKLSASTISAALTTHHGANAGVTNGASLGSPLPAANNTNLTCATNFASNSCVLPQALSSCESTPKKLSPMASVGVSPIHSRQGSDLGSAKSDSDINHKNVCSTLDADTPGRSYLETSFPGTHAGNDVTDEAPKVNGFPHGDFHYKTLSGSVIRSVHAPGKGKSISYKLNTNISGPKPFGSGPLSPPSAGPKSPSIYPPPTNTAAWTAPKPVPTFEAPKAAPFGSATLPRATVGSTAPDLGPEGVQTDDGGEHFMWPPASAVAESAPTATPLYVPPPGTQHVIVKPMVEKQSHSAPDLSYGQTELSRIAEVVEMESGSESYTSTSATTTTSEEMAHRMFHTQTSVPSYTVYESADSDANETDYAMMQHHKQSICSAEVSSFVSETRGAQYLADTLDTTCLVERMRSLTPRPPSPPPIKPAKHVEFSIPTEEAAPAEVHEVQEVTQVQESEESQNIQQISAEATQIEEQSTQFQPIEVPESKPLPQSGVTNTVPQEWESAMVKALKTAPETPYHITSVQQECVEEKCERVDASQSTSTTTFKSVELPQLDVLVEKPAEGTIMSSLLTTVPTKSVKFEPKVTMEPIPLPEETKPYFPPPIDMKFVADDTIPGRKSGMLEALITAPDRPYSPFAHDVSYQLEDLPRPTEKMTLRTALTVAPDRPFTPVLFDSNGLAHPKDVICSTSLESVQTSEQKSSQLSTSQTSAFQSVKTSSHASQFSASQSCRQECRETVCHAMSAEEKTEARRLVDSAAVVLEQDGIESRAADVPTAPQTASPAPHPRPFTPSLINKPAPIIPYYQQNLAVSECDPHLGEIFDPKLRSPSPCLREKSPAQGPPPNPLRMQAPRLRESGQLGAFSSAQVQAQSVFQQKPEALECQRIGDTLQQTRTNEASLSRSLHAAQESASATQVGNTLVQKRSRVVEEFERTQTAKTVEIRTGGAGEVVSKITEDEMPPKGIVASQTRRFSQEGVQPKVTFPASIPLAPMHFPVAGANTVAPPPGFNFTSSNASAFASKTSSQLTFGAKSNAFTNTDAQPPAPPTNNPSSAMSDPSPDASAGPRGGAAGVTSAPKRGRGVLNKAVAPGGRIPQCGCCSQHIRGPFITALGRIWCPDHFICVNADCRRPLADIGFVEEKGNLYCEYCFEKYIAPACSKCSAKIKGDCLNAIGKHFHPECFTCAYCGKLFGNSPFFLEEGNPYCEADWNELFTTKCFACGFPVEAGDRWVEALSHNYHSQCFNCTTCKKNLEGQSFFAKGGRPYCKNHAR
ncbi:PDZ and LIM domain protein Zasp-like isoform X2 [Phlebotomus argentipes]|uniref:PDZ and LIM domain protein Zasp-like isoform X2 n=1 Tax=Phlebotomus argentipes TaxID=94469 RepID=UPI002893403E|nr:PDZ and LIM domain protein Zasp-like isoform X2 [Phlebotomus argentipes]